MGWVAVAAQNAPPTANAGFDQTVTAADNSGSEMVLLDASASSDPDGSIVAYEWREGGALIASGVNPTVELAVGVHTLTLTVTDDDGASASDEVVITVEPASSGSSTLEGSGADALADGSDTMLYSGRPSGSQAAWGREGTDVLDVSESGSIRIP